ncbi:MAG: ABC transporter substrate-binding protein [Rhodospirillales bacterium]|nr:ABC transporter substrate-binding protein [Rhodospirillales bacterium]MDE2200112.1 ABC transporter substrate-binding protein [Rhodospirillales bacterium]MDE2574739.1 ABC transporter substrate-binding protein [Rhodospirillales bacterium]
MDRKIVGLRRRTLLTAGATLGGLQLASPFIISARGEAPVKIGMVDPLTGSLSAPAGPEVEGAKYAVAELNKAGGILGRQIQLLVEDSANDVGTGVQKTRKLIDRDKVDVIFGDVNSGIAYAMSQVTNEKKVLHIVPGGHTDPITGADCKWNVFRICNTTTMDATAVSGELIKRFGKRWFFITPDYAYGHSLQDAFVKQLKKAGGEYQGDMLPIANSDFSGTLIKAKAYKPDVLLNNMGGLAQVDCMKQFTQFGMEKEMALGGALFELEALQAVPVEAKAGWWTMEWWWNQPGVPHVAEFVAAFRKATGKTPSARHWFGVVAVHSVKLAAEKAKALDSLKMAHALEDLELPADVALQPGKVRYRAGDHELMPNIFVGNAHPAKAGANPDDMFTVAKLVPGEEAAGSVADTGCHMKYPA